MAGVALVMAVLAAVAPGTFGSGGEGPLRWDGRPRTAAMAGTPGDRLLFGRVVNRSDRVVRLRAAEVHVVDGGGDELATSAAFAEGYVAAVSLRGYDAELYAAGAPVAVGQEVSLAPGESAPLSVSFSAADRGAAAAVAYGKSRLALE